MLWEILEVVLLGLVTLVVVVMCFEHYAHKIGSHGPVDWVADKWHQLTCKHPAEAADVWFDAARDCWFDICQVCAKTWYPAGTKPNLTAWQRATRVFLRLSGKKPKQ